MRRALVLLALLVPLASASPTQVHLGMDDEGHRVVSWYDETPESDPSVTAGGVRVVGRHVPGPAAGFVYEATLPDLPAGAPLEYTLGDRTFPLPLARTGDPLRVAVVGDMGLRPEADGAVIAMLAAGVDLVLHAGDVSYAEGNQATWNAWFEMVEPVAASAPWMVAIGNHEASVLGATRPVPNPPEQAYYRQRFAFPGNELWYSFDVGPIHVVALDTFSEMEVSQAQLDWLANDLAAAADAPWIIAFLHEPPYSSNDAHGSKERAQQFSPLLEAGDVDLVLSAHDHAYERTFPLRGGEVTVRTNETTAGDGIVYLVSGGGGEELYETWEEPQPDWSAAREALHHIVLLEITPTRLAGRVVPTTGSAFADAFRIDAADAGRLPAAVIAPDVVPGVAVVPALAALGLLALARRRP